MYVLLWCQGGWAEEKYTEPGLILSPVGEILCQQIVSSFCASVSPSFRLRDFFSYMSNKERNRRTVI